MNALLAAFANAFVLGTVLSATVGALLWLLPKRTLNAATRYLIWWVTLALVIASPLLYVVDAPSRSGFPAVASTITAAGQSMPKSLYPSGNSSERIRQLTPTPRPLSDRPSSVSSPVKDDQPAGRPAFPVRLAIGVVPQLLLLTLLFSGGIMVTRMVVSFLTLEHRKRSASAAPARFQARIAEWLARCGSRRKDVRLLSCSEISVPMAVGPRNPAILIPSSLFDRLADWEIEPLGLHEAAHLARGDDYALLIQRAIEALFVWNPLVRWIRCRIDLEREMACDDLVVAITGEPRQYASCLTNIAEMSLGRPGRSLVAAGVTQTGKQLCRRVETLLDRSRQRATKVLRFRAAALVVAEMAFVIGAGAMPAVFSFADSVSQQSPAEITQAIAAQAIRLDTVEAGRGFADMQPLKKVIGDARIVALGEATHGTREFFQLKHRMLEFLATEMGFTIFSIEANMPEAYRLNDFVLNGQGDPKQLLKGMYFWTWDTEEVLDMILWMREFNKSGKGRVEFTGFDMQTPDVAVKIVEDFVAKNDPQYLADVRTASALTRSAARQGMASGASFGVATGGFPVEPARGKRVTYSGYIKTEAVTRGFAGLWWRVDGRDGKILAFDNMQNRGVTGTTDWQRYEIELPVAPDAVNINFGALHTGDGTAWFDGLKVELDGQSYVDEQSFDFDFEAGVPTGFYTGGEGYKVAPDKQVFKTGSQSLRMQYVGGPVVPKPEDKPAARASWEAVLRHLEQSSQGYLEKGVAKREVNWAVQNARVGLQCLQMLTNQVSRDQSMAANVKWILDQSPGAKIVLWAHNGHVSRAGTGGYEPMGSYLSKMYGEQMVVFGFAFNQGSFQAIGKGLQDFTVPPAPPGSLDATLAAAGIPILALDLRQPPSGSALATWLSKPHQTRSIGAVYSEERAASFFASQAVRDCFDVVLFVEKTSAARKNAESGTPIFSPVAPPTEAKTGKQEFRDEETGVSFSLPAGWTIERAQRWGDRETTAWFAGQGTKAFSALYFKMYSTPQDGSTDAVMQRLKSEVQPKVAQRISQGFSDYRLNPDACRARKVGGRVAWSCTGEFTQDGQPMKEYLTWVGSENTLGLFFGRVPAADFERFCAQFDPIIETLKIR